MHYINFFSYTMSENNSNILNILSDNIYKLKIFRFHQLYDKNAATKYDPKPRSGHRIVCKNTSLYSIGGYNPDGLPLDSLSNALLHEVWNFNFVTKSWIKLETINLPREHASCAIVLSGNLLFLYGGTGYPFGDKINNYVYKCKLNSSASKVEFNAIISTSDISPWYQYGQSIAIVDDYLYTIGGTDGFAYTNDVFRLNLKTSKWERLGTTGDVNSPSPRYRHEIVYYNNYLYVFGGGTSQRACTLEKVPAFNLQSHAWTVFQTRGDNSSSKKKFPANRRCHGCVQDPYNKSLVFINGGCHQKSYNDTWRIDLDTLQWNHISSLNLSSGIFFHSTAVTPDGRMIIFGGCTGNPTSNQRTSDIYSTWITIPKLVDACWDALLYYINKKILVLPINVKELGLPLKFECRLNMSYNKMDVSP